LSFVLNDSAANQEVLLIGVGSPFNDDTLGWQLLDALQQELATLPGYEWVFEKADRPGPVLLERMKGYERAVLLDALDAGLPPGTIHVLRKEELAQIHRPASSHAIGVAEALALGERLQMLPSELHLLGVQMGSGLSEQVVQAAVAKLEQILVTPGAE
jgi:hydrogenase maturation protease